MGWVGLVLCLNSMDIFGLGTKKLESSVVFWVKPLDTRLTTQFYFQLWLIILCMCLPCYKQRFYLHNFKNHKKHFCTSKARGKTKWDIIKIIFFTKKNIRFKLHVCSFELVLGGVIYVAAVIQLSLFIDQFYSIFLIFFILSLLSSCVFILIIIPFLTSIFTIFFSFECCA